MALNLLAGNGINIQFDRHSYTTQQIVLRILKNCDRDDFPSVMCGNSLLRVWIVCGTTVLSFEGAQKRIA